MVVLHKRTFSIQNVKIMHVDSCKWQTLSWRGLHSQEALIMINRVATLTKSSMTV